MLFFTLGGAECGFYDRIKGAKRLVVLEGCGHFPVEEPGQHQLEEAIQSMVRTQA